MLQFIAEYNEKYSIPEQAQMAIEGGCKWIVLRANDITDEEIREMCVELVPLCKETSTILTIENRLELAKELAIHGVHLRNSDVSPQEAREILGPEAIVGVEVKVASEALPLEALDIDYVSYSLKEQKTLEHIGEQIEALRNEKFTLPVVVEGDFDTAAAVKAMAIGANGVAVGKWIADSADPVAATEALIRGLENIQEQKD